MLIQLVQIIEDVFQEFDFLPFMMDAEQDEDQVQSKDSAYQDIDSVQQTLKRACHRLEVWRDTFILRDNKRD